MSNRYLEKIANWKEDAAKLGTGAALGAIAGAGVTAPIIRSNEKRKREISSKIMFAAGHLSGRYPGKTLPEIVQIQKAEREAAASKSTAVEKKAEVQASDIAAPVIGAGVGVSAGTALGKRIVDKTMGDKVVRLSKGVQRVNDLGDRNHQQRVRDAIKFRGDQEKSIRASSIIPTEVKPELYEKLKENEKATIEKSVKDSTDRLTKRYNKINRVASKMEKGIINKGRLVGGAVGLGIGGAIAYGMHKKEAEEKKEKTLPKEVGKGIAIGGGVGGILAYAEGAREGAVRAYEVQGRLERKVEGRVRRTWDKMEDARNAAYKRQDEETDKYFKRDTPSSESYEEMSKRHSRELKDVSDTAKYNVDRIRKRGYARADKFVEGIPGRIARKVGAIGALAGGAMGAGLGYYSYHRDKKEQENTTP